jgi:hypothetical protein
MPNESNAFDSQLIFGRAGSLVAPPACLLAGLLVRGAAGMRIGCDRGRWMQLGSAGGWNPIEQNGREAAPMRAPEPPVSSALTARLPVQR